MNDSLFQTALRAHQAGNLTEAARLTRETLRADASHSGAHFLIGTIHWQQGRPEDALAAFNEVCRLNPTFAEAWNNRAIALHRLGRFDDALASFDKALAIAPRRPEILVSRAGTLSALQRESEALAACEHALEFDSSYAAALSGRANSLARLGRFEDALVAFTKALAKSPRDADLLNARVHAFFILHRYEEAAKDCAGVLALDPDYPFARGLMVHCRLQCCDWTELAKERDAIAAGLKAGRKVISAFANVGLSHSPLDQLAAARIWTKERYPTQPPLWKGERYRHDKIRVAYLSADYRLHATPLLMAGVFEQHDRSRFETYAVSFSADDKSAMRKRLEAAFTRFIDIGGMSDIATARMMRELEIDIAIDLKGYTEGCRPGILAHRPAPVQAHYLGYPGTMGAQHIDYIIADAVVLPEEHRRYYSEKAVILPHSYQCNDSRRARPAPPQTRANVGLPQNGFVFCSFNNSYKIAPGLFDIWMRLLTSVDGSVLWLLEYEPAAARNLRREAEARGVNASRLVFAPRVNPDAHLARQQMADLFLDTLPYCAHTTASDALWMDLPVVTCVGSTFAGRVAASLLTALGVPELITQSLGDYETLALKLAREPGELARIKAKIAANRETQPLFDTVRITRDLERAYVAMHERAEQGAMPESFAVAP